MAKVNLKELEEKAELERKKASLSGVQEKELSGKKLFKGPFLEDWFDDYGECLMANTEAKKQAEYKKAGLDEFGRSPEQVLLNKKKAELLLKKAEILKEAAAIDLQIASLRVEASEKKEVSKPKVKK